MDNDVNNMDVTRAYKFRTYPDAKHQSEINLQLVLSKEFYNLLLEKSIKAYREWSNKFSMAILNRFAKEIEKDRKILQIYLQTRCEMKYRVLKAYQNFFRRCNEKNSGKKIKVGFRHFKPGNRCKSIIYQQDTGITCAKNQ
jgi:putative transposase